MLRYIYSFIFLIACLEASGQTEDSVQSTQKLPAFTDNRLLNGIRVGVDVAGIAYGFMVNDENFKISEKYELNADLGIKRFFALLDLGRGTFQRTTFPTASLPISSNYTSSGTYFRVGGDYRISKSAKSFLFAGARFGKAFIKENYDYRAETAITYSNNLSVNWFELNTGVKAHIWKNFYLGYTLRFKFLVRGKKVKEEEPLDVPGFGVANGNNNMGMSFHIMYRIPFGKDPVIIN